jgi:SAM-dependent methyltransferase
MTMSWDEAFANRYEEWSADMTADVAFYIELARKADGPLVELAIGNGWVAIPVAQATGQRVIGIDSSPAMLEQARAPALHIFVPHSHDSLRLRTGSSAAQPKENGSHDTEPITLLERLIQRGGASAITRDAGSRDSER